MIGYGDGNKIAHAARVRQHGGWHTSTLSGILVGNNWIRGSIWFDLIEKQKTGTITEIERKILIKGHFELK